MDLSEVREGETRILVPVAEKLTKKNVVFYNPHMELNRDISVAVASIIQPREFCDLLSGSGARAVRIAKEAGVSVTANDLNPSAVSLIEKNAKLNGVEIEIENKSANLLLEERRFDFIDLDPFGPPIRFMDSALRSVTNKGVLAVTATDTSALCGTYPRASRRKYDAVSLRTDYYDEAGLRILIGYVARNALKYGLCVEPLFSHSTRHYFRTYVKVRRSSSGTKKILGELKYLKHCHKCLRREYAGLDELGGSCPCGGSWSYAGPLWSESFAKPSFCEELSGVFEKKTFGSRKEALKMVGLIEGEQGITTPYYDVHKLYKKLSLPVKPTESIISAFVDSGFGVSRTHFSDLGLRLDADLESIYSLLR